MDLSVLLLFCGASLALALTPGPDMILMASRSLVHGPLAGFVTWAGIALGCYVHGVAIALGLSQVIAASPLTYDIIRYAGAAYLLYLAFQLLRPKVPMAAEVAEGAKVSLASMFVTGLLTNLLNPKVIMFMLALLPQFMNPLQGAMMMQAMALITILNLFGLLVNGTVIVFAGVFSKRLKQRHGRGWADYLMAALFSALAVRLLVSR